MNLHERYSFLWPKYDAERVRLLLVPEALAVARIEPVYSPRLEALIDLTFERDGEWLVVPLLRLDGIPLATLETPPISWPSWLENVSEDIFSEIEARLIPWARSLTAARFFNDEAWRFFRDEAPIQETFAAARDAQLLGAALVQDVFQNVAPAVYAQRFARGGRAAVAGPHAGNRAVALSAVAERCDAMLSPLQARWFSALATGEISRDLEYDCYVGPRDAEMRARFHVLDDGAREAERAISIVQPIPIEINVSFDPDDAPVVGHFAVTERTVDVTPLSFARTPSAGGSSGCIYLVIRDDGGRFSDADTDAAYALAQGLRDEGFDARVSIASRVDLEEADILHVFGLRHSASIVGLMRDAEAAEVPTVLTPYADDRRREGVTATRGAVMLPRCAIDGIELEQLYWAFGRRKIENIASGDVYDEASRVLVQRAASVLVTCAAEEEMMRERFGYHGPAAQSAVQTPVAQPDGAIGSLVGNDEYVLLHAPLEPSANQLLVVRGAQREGLPLVLLGAVGDIEYYRYIVAIQGALTVQLRDAALTPNQIAGVYARARVVVDAGATSRGLGRLGFGMAYGAAPVGTTSGYAQEVWEGLVEMADPMDADSVQQALRRAWNRQPNDRTAFFNAARASCDPRSALLAAVSAYQQAAMPAVR